MGTCESNSCVAAGFSLRKLRKLKPAATNYIKGMGLVIYLLSDDLMFSSRVSGTARALGLQVQTGRTVEQIRNLLSGQAPQTLLVDLQVAGPRLGEVMQSLPQPRPFVVGYGSHVDTTALKAAKDAGCDLVLPRSKFAEMLEKSLGDWRPEKT